MFGAMSPWRTLRGGGGSHRIGRCARSRPSCEPGSRRGRAPGRPRHHRPSYAGLDDLARSLTRNRPPFRDGTHPRWGPLHRPACFILITSRPHPLAVFAFDLPEFFSGQSFRNPRFRRCSRRRRCCNDRASPRQAQPPLPTSHILALPDFSVFSARHRVSVPLCERLAASIRIPGGHGPPTGHWPRLNMHVSIQDGWVFRLKRSVRDSDLNRCSDAYPVCERQLPSDDWPADTGARAARKHLTSSPYVAIVTA
jgi:hypothetical protein